MFKEKMKLISGTNILSEKTAIIFDIKIENELYVIASPGFFDATIIPVMIGIYVFINIIEFLILVAASVNILPIESIINDIIIKIEI